jgi:purine-binding chemotaxis protein CheW
MAEVINAQSESPKSIRGEGSKVGGTSWSQYVTFMVDHRVYGIEITKVREIKGWSDPTELPNAPHASRGVLNLRGVIVPIFDLRARFGQGETQVSDANVVIIVALADRQIGILVDAVSDILTLEPGEVLPVPDMTGGADQGFLSGLVSRDDRLVALLRLEALFAMGDLPDDL